MKIAKNLSLLAGVALLVGSCAKDLNLTPKYGMNAEAVYSDFENYDNVLAKLYGGLAVSGNNGPAGQPDISGIDEGFSQYIRLLWNLQELPTDEVVCGWNDPGVPELVTMTWDPTSSFVNSFYYRTYYQIALTNEFIRYTTDEWTDSKGFSAEQKLVVKQMKAEARFLRALSYYHAMDLYGNIPFVDESDRPGVYYPERKTREEVYAYVVDELNAVEADLPNRINTMYGRASKGALYALRAKVYLNAEVYTGTPKWNECMADCEKAIQEGYSLDPNYRHMFLADNHLSPEFIFAVPFDGNRTRNYGGTTFLVHGNMHNQLYGIDYGTTSAWQGLRARKSFSDVLNDTLDSRYTFGIRGREIAGVGPNADTTYTRQTDTIDDFADPYQGYVVTKWRNVDRNGNPGVEPVTFVDVDFPMFRLADIYLMYAECAVRTGTNLGTALGYFNDLRTRAYGNSSNLAASLNLQLILDERMRELHYEGHRRQDLVRFGKFAGSTYIWPFKGGVKEGMSTDGHLDLYPLPASDVLANPNLRQNDGY